MQIKIKICSAYPDARDSFAASALRLELLALGNEGEAVCTDNPEEADVILFFESHPGLDPLFFQVYAHPLFRQYAGKCILYHDSDYAYPVVKGIYPSALRTGLQAPWVESSPYFFQICENPWVGREQSFPEQTRLYSFAGAARTHACRAEILKLQTDDRALIKDTSQYNGWQLDGEQQNEYHRQFAETLRSSLFVLCPRGNSPCSYRLTEAMKAGRVPVIISDAWRKPRWLPWDEFSLQIPEADIALIPEILRAREASARSMGNCARKMWESYLASERRIVTIIQLVRSLNEVQAPAFSPLCAMGKTFFLTLPRPVGRTLLKHQLVNLLRKALNRL